MCKSSKTEAVKADQMEESDGGVHIAEIHSAFHTSGACVISFCLVILAIILLLYCYRHRLCIEVVPARTAAAAPNSMSHFERFRRSLCYSRHDPPVNDIDCDWKNNPTVKTNV